MICNDRQVWLHAAGYQLRLPPRHLHFRYYHGQKPPKWLTDQVFYQILPDRFCPGDDDSIHVKTGEYQYMGKPVLRRRWGETPSDKPDESAHEFFGGDLYGVLKKLDYLQVRWKGLLDIVGRLKDNCSSRQELGVTALYLTPVFSSPSNHGYDATDYFHVRRRNVHVCSTDYCLSELPRSKSTTAAMRR